MEGKGKIKAERRRTDSVSVWTRWFIVLTGLCMLIAACSESDTNTEEPNTEPSVGNVSTGIPFSTTLAPREDAYIVRAVSSEQNPGGNEFIEREWKEGEHLAIYYEKTDGTFATVHASITAIDEQTGEAYLSAELDNDAKHGGKARIIYPESLHNEEGDIDEERLLSTQWGILEHSGKGTDYSISKNYDAATADVILTVGPNESTAGKGIIMRNRVGIVKMEFNRERYGLITRLEKIELTVGDKQYKIVPRGFSEKTPYIYAALLPIENEMLIVDLFNQSIAAANSDDIEYMETYKGIIFDFSLREGEFRDCKSIALLDENNSKDISKGPITVEGLTYIYQSNERINNSAITIKDNATAVLLGIRLGNRIVCEGNAQIILRGKNEIYMFNYSPIEVGKKDKTLIISGEGTLLIDTEYSSPAIGNGLKAECGNIIIEGGYIEIVMNSKNPGVYSNKPAPGIGASANSKCGNIDISPNIQGIKMKLEGNPQYAIGIADETSTCGTITIGGKLYYDGNDFVNGGKEYLSNSNFEYIPKH